jgi:hypothetical protein
MVLKLTQRMNRYTVLVSGDVDLTPYNLGVKVEPYVLYRYSERENIQQKTVELYRGLLEEMKDNPVVQSLLTLKLQDIEELTPEEFFDEITKGCTYDEITGDAISDTNPQGKWLYLTEPTEETAVPLFENSEHLFEGIKANVVPDTPPEAKTIHTALFYNAFVSEDTGWIEEIDENPQDWVLSFYDRFIKDLPDNTKLKVYNFTR